VVASGAFAVVVIDLAGVPGAKVAPRLDRWVNAVRRLSIAAEGSETSVLLLTDSHAPRSMPLPAALRLELDRASQDRLVLRVAKDRRGRVAPAVSIPLPFEMRRPGIASAPAEPPPPPASSPTLKSA
jgi:hypothetical protein